jgi:4,5-DOPA dioxygenase extradiol
MRRKRFLQSLVILPAAGAAMQLRHLEKYTDPLPATDIMPVLFLGHGSPMNAIEENEFVKGWRHVGTTLPRPKAILCISAHWETRGTYVTAMEKPRTIHDFGGFPPALFAVQYPAPGDPEIAALTKESITKTDVGLDQQWGLDHGCWSVVKRLYPDADIPVLQLSLDYQKDAAYHYELARELSALRRKGILIIGSGNMVHNLGIMNWQLPESGYDWAVEANTLMKQHITNRNHTALVRYSGLGKAVKLSIPTAEHYLPLLYTLGLQEAKEEVQMFNDRTIMGSISMTSLKIT